ncbi:histidine phosphatase family protein [Lyngbya sp. CCY1209]|jgi:probable phosphoglycerate mutase|uniref:histidine phosphatase family protein n=1 Tax=Lyngbya sp. CCY1209 TaxID=2886103 RepID=UPI002D20A9CC|nr:histidine phosphatase family protein [Lyngbya sp. CCY1209]MEB3885227.1 histidine phosphatase family protein [Lyngbya sp. CCY1209]
MTLKLYFLRHGETVQSRTGGYCGNLDPELTEEGMEMAREFAETHRNLPWVAAYVSPMKRTIATAKPLCESVGIPVEVREGLKEIAYGEWEGESPETVNEKYHDDYVRWLTDPGWNAPTGGEKGVDVARRSYAVLREIQEQHESGNVLVVSHKATIRIMLCQLLGIDVGRFRDRLLMPVGGVSLIEMEAHGPLMHALGDRSYLSERLRSLAGT